MAKQKFAAFDIDGTLFRSGLYREVAYELMRMGVLPPDVLEETTAKNREWRHRTHGDAFEEFDMLVVDRIDSQLPYIKISDYEKAAQTVIEKRAENKNAYNPWTKEDDDKLELLFCEGKTTNELSEIFSRNKGAINSRIKKLELKEKYCG